MVSWFKPKEGPFDVRYAHHQYGIDLVQFYSDHAPAMKDKAIALTEWLGNVLGTNSVGMGTHTPIMREIDPLFDIRHGQFELRNDRNATERNRPSVFLVLQLVGKSPMAGIPHTKTIGVDQLAMDEFKLVRNEHIEDHQRQWRPFIDAMKDWNATPATMGQGLPLANDVDLQFYPDSAEDGEFLFIGPKWSDAVLLMTRLDQYRAVEMIHALYPQGLREIVSLVRKYQKYHTHREHMRKGASKGCKFEVSEFVRRIPTDLRKVFDPVETWECFKVCGHVSAEQQVLFLSETPSYPPDMVLITPDLQRFLAFSGDWVASVRGQPQSRKRRGN